MSELFYQIIIPLAFSMLFFWRYLQRKKALSQVSLLLSQGGVVVDVRTESEYAQGHYPDSLNIPLDQLEKKISEIDRDRPVILCCASGARSGMARQVLRQKGYLNVVNAGSWRSL